MGRKRIVGRRTARFRELGNARVGIGRERLKIVAQLRTAPKEIDPVFDSLARIGERARELGNIGKPRLENDVPQIERAFVAVETADRAVVVGVRVDRNDDRPEPVAPRIDCSNEKGPGTRRGARKTGVEKAQPAARGAGGGGIEP